MRVSCIRNCALVGRTNSRLKKRRSLRYGRKSVFRVLVPPMQIGVHFLPATAEEFRITQRYLQSMSSKDPAVTWYCYTPTNEHPMKVGVRGLPGDTNLQEILVALQQLDFPATYARHIPPCRDRSGCLFFIQLEHLNEEEHGHVSPIKMYATHMCNGCTVYKMQLEWCIRHRCTPTVTCEG
ncbi:hypothetical protein EVAR_94516_1 [Eumeta japonica]|uniref:Nucleic-acid-binding protein from transposon X-element n=1 Tax=Eumeta variegata TaxID=151549 RepID=A0A4C1UUU0_EUMVA|nr:hypothetical protein EVAR_94516_1 [Eumeta japonica]